MTIRDQIGMAYNAQGLDWNQEMPLFRLMEACGRCRTRHRH